MLRAGQAAGRAEVTLEQMIDADPGESLGGVIEVAVAPQTEAGKAKRTEGEVGLVNPPAEVICPSGQRSRVADGSIGVLLGGALRHHDAR